MLPVKEFPVKPKSIRLAIDPKKDGRVPSRLLWSRAKSVKAFRAVKVLGIESASKLPLKFNDFSTVNIPISVGILFSNELNPKFIEVRPVRFPIVVGIFPVNELRFIAIESRDVNWPISVGKDPKSEF
jgi:hypothetical protein